MAGSHFFLPNKFQYSNPELLTNKNKTRPPFEDSLAVYSQGNNYPLSAPSIAAFIWAAVLFVGSKDKAFSIKGIAF